MIALTFLFSFKGRLGRKPFFLYNLAVSIGYLFLILLLDRDHPFRSHHPAFTIYAILVLWPSLAIMAKRLHDVGRSAWHILLVLIPIIGPLWVYGHLSLARGVPGTNRYGDDVLPKNASFQEYTRPNTTPYLVEAASFLLLPIGLIWIMFSSFRRGNMFSLVYGAVVLAIVLGVFVYMRQRRVMKLVLTENGITFHGLLRRNTFTWPEIKSVGISSRSLADAIEVNTTKGAFIIPAVYQDPAEPFPQLVNGPNGPVWVQSDGTRREASPQNSPLYGAIQERLKMTT